MTSWMFLGYCGQFLRGPERDKADNHHSTATEMDYNVMSAGERETKRDGKGEKEN